MNKVLSTIAIVIGVAAAASAQAKLGDVTASTDPAKAASVEKQAAALKSGHMHRTRHASRHVAKPAQHASLQHLSGQKAPTKS